MRGFIGKILPIIMTLAVVFTMIVIASDFKTATDSIGMIAVVVSLGGALIYYI